mmetsp:Transcript_14130/g.46416  ORF Transcript_14130/g.46416 Transcript_14130/m.46416 type:complete len:145 (-) Transcript_14130:893-1327(-)
MLFSDIFKVLQKDADGKRFDRVSRFICVGVNTSMDLELDINIDLYPCKEGEKFTFALTNTLSPEGTMDDGQFDQSGTPSLADSYDYVMYGKLFKYADDNSSGSPRVEIFVSFGGLLMLLKGDPAQVAGLEVDQSLYLLMRKVAA